MIYNESVKLKDTHKLSCFGVKRGFIGQPFKVVVQHGYLMNYCVNTDILCSCG